MNSDNKEFRIKSLFFVMKEVDKLAQKLKIEKKSTALIHPFSAMGHPLKPIVSWFDVEGYPRFMSTSRELNN
jgi:hypothetical protein